MVRRLLLVLAFVSWSSPRRHIDRLYRIYCRNCTESDRRVLIQALHTAHVVGVGHRTSGCTAWEGDSVYGLGGLSLLDS